MCKKKACRQNCDVFNCMQKKIPRQKKRGIKTLKSIINLLQQMLLAGGDMHLHFGRFVMQESSFWFS